MVYDGLLAYFFKNKLKGKDRLYGLFQSFGFKKLITLKCKYDILLHLNPNEYIDRVTIEEGFYESEITDAILAVLNNNDTFWDIGANIGLHSLAVKKTLPGVNVVSFEPNPNTVNLLHQNAALNNLEIDVCGFALYDKMQVGTLHIRAGNAGMTTLKPWEETKYKSTVKCSTFTGNYLVKNGFKIPTVLKIDTEGTELEILKGCSDFLGASEVKAIILEAANDLLSDSNTDDFAGYLSQFGFNDIVKLERKEATHHGLSNYMFSKK